MVLVGRPEQRAGSARVPPEQRYLVASGSHALSCRMIFSPAPFTARKPAVTPSPRTRHSELLRLCARIGYSPHAPA